MSDERAIVHRRAAGPQGVADEETIDVRGIELPPLWERQDWETAAAYEAFVQYYLPQDPPRSVVEAYRRWGQKGGKKGAKKSEIRQAPGNWNRWAHALDKQGHRIPNTATWEQRAAARDKYLRALSFRDEERLWRVRRREIREMEFQEGQQLMQRVTRMRSAVLFEKHEESFVTVGDVKVPQVIVYRPGAWTERDIAAAAKIASELMRRAAELPLNQAEQDWRREIERQFPDLDPDEVRDVFVNAFGDFLAKRGIYD